jgi:ribonuclease HI
MEVTGASFSSPPAEFINQHDFQGWLMDWFSKLKPDERALACMLLYQLWLARNNTRDGRIIEDPEATACRAGALVDEWLEIHAKPPAEKSQVRERWSPPAETWLKFNTNGSFSAPTGCGGGGVVVRDHTGRFIAGKCLFFPAAVDPEGAEALACKRALQLAKELGCQRLVLETDNANVAAKLNEETRDLSALGPIIEEVKTMLWDIMFYEVKAVRRTGNLVAHKLATEGYMDKCTQTWFSEAPNCIKSVLSADVE